MRLNLCQTLSAKRHTFIIKLNQKIYRRIITKNSYEIKVTKKISFIFCTTHRYQRIK